MRCFTRLKKVFFGVALVVILSISVASAAEITTDPPADPPWSGGYFITGTSALGTVTVYTPVNDGWCLDADGYLFRYASSSTTGKVYTSSGTVYDFRAPAFAAAQYRATDSSYTYSDLRLIPASANVVISTDFEPLLDQDYMIQLLQAALLGLLFVVIISKGGRH